MIRPKRRVFPGRSDQVACARRFVGRALDGCPAADEAVLCVSELTTNTLLFSLLCFRVAIAAIGGKADLRPALFDYLFLAAACRGTTCDGSASSRAGQLRHGYYRTRRVRREIRHTVSGQGGEFEVIVYRGESSVLVCVRDDGSEKIPAARTFDGSAEDGRGLGLVALVADRWGQSGDEEGRTVWFELGWQARPVSCPAGELSPELVALGDG